MSVSIATILIRIGEGTRLACPSRRLAAKKRIVCLRENWLLALRRPFAVGEGADRCTVFPDGHWRVRSPGPVNGAA